MAADIAPASPPEGRVYVPTLAGFVYLASILDMFSRRVVGWPVAKGLSTERVLNALDKTVEQGQVDTVIQYADPECRQCAYYAFGEHYQRWSRPDRHYSFGPTSEPIRSEWTQRDPPSRTRSPTGDKRRHGSEQSRLAQI